MPKKRTSSSQPSIKIGNISDISGSVNVAGGNITTHHTSTGLSTAEIRQLFDQVYARIEARPGTSTPDKEDLREEVRQIQVSMTEASQKDEKLDDGFLSRRFRNIARMAPDVLDIVVAMLANPLAGLGVAVKKIAEKAKEETKQI